MIWSPPVLWTVAGLALIALEALVPGLIIMFFGVGALITALACLLMDLSWAAQVVIFACASVLCLVTLRGTLAKVFQGRQRQDQEQVESIGSLVGADAVVTEAIEAGGTGRVKLRGSYYTATSDEALAVGQRVRVVTDQGGDHSLLTVEKK